MTRIMTNPELVKSIHQKRPEEHVWFCRTLHNAAPGNFRRVVSPLLRNGSVIEQIKIQARMYPPGPNLWIEVYVCLVSSKEPTGLEIQQAEQVIVWNDLAGVGPWYSYGDVIDETWPVNKIVSGSDKRLCFSFSNLGPSAADARVGVMYTL